MRTSESTAEISKALAKVQGSVEAPKRTKTADTGSFKYTYADLDSIIAGVRELLAANGLSFTQGAVSAEGKCGVITRLLHTSGEWIETGPLFLPAGNTPQAYGSAITYARRYALTSLLGIATEEDDDAAAAQRSQRAKNGAQTRKAAPKQENVVQMDPLKAKVVELSKAVKDEKIPTETAAALIGEWFGDGKTTKDLDAAQLETATLGVRRYAAVLRKGAALAAEMADNPDAQQMWKLAEEGSLSDSEAKELVTTLEGLKAGAQA